MGLFIDIVRIPYSRTCIRVPERVVLLPLAVEERAEPIGDCVSGSVQYRVSLDDLLFVCLDVAHLAAVCTLASCYSTLSWTTRR